MNKLLLLMACLLLVPSVVQADLASEPPIRFVGVCMDGIQFESFWDLATRVTGELVPRGMYFSDIWIEPLPTGYRSATTWAHVGVFGGVNDSLGGPQGIFGETPPENPMIFHVLIGDYGWPVDWCGIIAGKKRVTDCFATTSHPDYTGIEPWWTTTAWHPVWMPPGVFYDGHDEDTIAAAKTAMLEHDFRFVFVNLGWADHSAHLADSVYSRYTDAVVNQDSLVVNFVDWVEALPSYAGRTVYFVFSDHGRDCPPEFMDHGGSVCAQHCFLIVWGPGIPAGVTIPTSYKQTDLAPTIATIMQAELPGELDGTPIGEILTYVTSVALGPPPAQDPELEGALDVYDVLGRRLTTVRAVAVDGRVTLAPKVTSGLYFVRPVGSRDTTPAKKVVVVR